VTQKLVTQASGDQGIDDQDIGGQAPISRQVVLLVVDTVSGTRRCGAERFRSLDLVLNNTRAGQV
jgi:hypothetical protein